MDLIPGKLEILFKKKCCVKDWINCYICKTSEKLGVN